MTIEGSRIIARRAVLTAGAAAAGAALVSGIGRPAFVAAADGETVTVGGEYSATTQTKITQTTVSEDAVVGVAKGGAGLRGQSTDGTGVYGSATSDISAGVYGYSAQGIGVSAYSAGDHLPAIYGSSLKRTGVVGLAGAADLGQAPANTGVYGIAANNSTADKGVYGLTPRGHGVHGDSDQGIGGYFHSGTGIALQAAGRVKFSSTGTATIAPGTRSKLVTPGMALTTDSRVLCTLQGDPGGAVTVQRVVVDAAADRFTIWLTAKATKSVKAAWFVIG